MDLNTIALWMGAVPAFMLLVRSARAPHRPLGWVCVAALLLVSNAAAWLLYREYAGYVSLLLLALFVLVPNSAQRAASNASNRFQYGRARRLLSFAAVLHPLDGWPLMPRLYRAFELAHFGKITEADALLRVLAAGTGSVATMAAAQRLRILGRWRDIKLLAERTGLLKLGRDPTLLVLYLRALGELDEVEALAEFMLAQERTLTATGALDAGLLYLFAFAGEVNLTREALGGARRVYTEEAREFWLALANARAGNLDLARRGFGHLGECDDAQIKARAEEYVRSLRQGISVEPTTPRTRAAVAHFARALLQHQHLIPNAPGRRPRRMTLVLLVANTLVYLVGSYPLLLDTQATFGERWAFFAPDIIAGEWWRVFSYLFVHANALHLGMNMAGLWALGPFVERAFGKLRFLFIYLIAGCTGSAVYLALGALEWAPPQQLVGASGCIMGLLGATAAVMLRAWIQQRAQVARQIFLRLVAVVLLQVAFDLSTPQVAGLAHALGLLGGFLGGLALREGISPERSVASLS